MPLSDIILAVLWQSEGLARPSVVLPLQAGLFILYCFSTKPLISGHSIKTMHPFDLLVTHTKPQLLTLRNHRDTVSQS
jgi:hypothetical protein